MEMEGLVAIVTGSGKGLGRTIAETFFREGARVALWDVDLELVKQTRDELDPSGMRAIAVQADVTIEAQVDRAVSETMERFGRLDVLVNNAGISRHRPIEEMTVDMFESVMKVNVTGTFICCRAVTPIMKQQKRGKIVNISSLGGRTGRPGVDVNYAAS